MKIYSLTRVLDYVERGGYPGAKAHVENALIGIDEERPSGLQVWRWAPSSPSKAVGLLAALEGVARTSVDYLARPVCSVTRHHYRAALLRLWYCIDYYEKNPS